MYQMPSVDGQCPGISILHIYSMQESQLPAYNLCNAPGRRRDGQGRETTAEVEVTTGAATLESLWRVKVLASQWTNWQPKRWPGIDAKWTRAGAFQETRLQLNGSVWSGGEHHADGTGNMGSPLSHPHLKGRRGMRDKIKCTEFRSIPRAHRSAAHLDPKRYCCIRN